MNIIIQVKKLRKLSDHLRNGFLGHVMVTKEVALSVETWTVTENLVKSFEGSLFNLFDGFFIISTGVSTMDAIYEGQNSPSTNDETIYETVSVQV